MGRAARTAITAAIAALSAVAAHDARAANGAYAVDAADISEVGSCKVESWMSTASNTDFLAVANPSCVVDPFRPIELSMQTVRARSDGDWSATVASSTVVWGMVGGQTVVWGMNDLVWDDPSAWDDAIVWGNATRWGDPILWNGAGTWGID